MSGFGGTGGFGSTGFGSGPSNLQGGGGFGGGGGGGGGFGGGFGSSTPSQPSNQNQSFGGFGTTPSGGFGSSTNAFPSSGFGSSSIPTQTSTTSGFGGTNPGGTFGNTPSSSGFGGVSGQSTSSGFGGSSNMTPTTFSSGFGNPPSSIGFGGSATAATFGSAPSSQPIQFGGGAASTNAFGGTTNTATGFGGTTTPSSTFGGGFTSSNAPAPVSGFGSSANPTSSGFSGGFAGGGGGPSGSAVSTQSGFGSFGTAPSSGLVFGSSSNTTTNPHGATRFGETNTGSSSRTWKPNSASSGSNPFGFGPAATTDDGMTDSGAPTTAGFSMADSHQNERSNMTFRPSSSKSSTNPMPEAGMGGGYDESEADDRKKAEADLKAKIELKKRQLQAKLEEKKRKQLEKQGERDGHSPLPGTIPVVSHGASVTKKETQSLAERNALRFGDQGGSSSLSRDMLPPEMKAKARTGQAQRAVSPENMGTFDQQKSTKREDLSTAKALVGTCEFFCPDEELLRREGENDIQQLEIPLPGRLHPSNWTLRNTVVKRFRRSAADYKLDVPEWVRPPDVLERVCAYLEEWVMERDRQGPDPRFPQGQTPPPLEVYQFIWDRTRMIRKDFTLQNYVGTGGQCDARAVRCHERIARWHAMCEHQLSHISDFVTMQSQQNIQELGQTMKTLNQFYDDSLRRATIEVPDEQGNETRHDLSGFAHGCASNIVEGKMPLEFDGTDLDNNPNGPDVSQRILGKHAVNHPSRGTAEPEMRGIYMLLTMNNEGGMEVLKYAAKLFEDRPEIYHSAPVQLALDIFKAKKEYNYARFFSILRAPSTPYLFCCIMFKHVELMRKAAFRIMNKTFGGRRKDGEGVDDSYPLSHLVELLCFEDSNEARAACEHFGITVKRVVSANGAEESDVIFWKSSAFKEPIHPEKKYAIPLQPWKMSRTIERKLKGATRLAVCRGQLSGEGATLQAGPTGTTSPFASNVPVPLFKEIIQSDDLLRRNELERRQQAEAQRAEEQRKASEIEERRLAMERKKKEEEDRTRREEEEKAAEREKDRELKVRAAKEKEEKARRRKEEEDRIAAEKRAQEAAHKREMEALAQRQKEEATRLAEQERRLAKEARLREEEARRIREQQQRILEEQRRLEEASRRERERIEMETKLKLEAEARRQEKEWEDKANAAKKILIWRRWKSRVSRIIESGHESSVSLGRLDPTFASSDFEFMPYYQKKRPLSTPNDFVGDDRRPPDIRRAVEESHQQISSRLSLSGMILDEVVASRSRDATKGTLLLMKVALLITHSSEEESEKMADLLLSWFDARVGVDKVDSAQLSVIDGRKAIRARSVVHLCRTPEDCFDCDVALIVVSPPWSTTRERHDTLRASVSILDDSIPRMALVLGDYRQDDYQEMRSLLVKTLGRNDGSLKIICNRVVSAEGIESALESTCRSLSSSFVNDSCVEIDRSTVTAFASRAVSACLWSPSSAQFASDPNVVLEHARFAISTFVEETERLVNLNKDMWSSWPPKDFLTAGGVQGYFSDGSSLPSNWRVSLRRENIGHALVVIQNLLVGSFRDVVECLLFGAPVHVRDDCNLLTTQGFYRRSLQLALEGFAQYIDDNDQQFVYFPRGAVDLIVEKLTTTTSGLEAETAPSLVLAAPDSPFLDIAILRQEAHLNESSTSLSTREEPIRYVVPTPPTSKRRRSDGSRMLWSQDRVKVPLSEKSKRSRGLHFPKMRRDVDESAALTKRMQDLVNGGTADLSVGDSFLSRFLRDVPTMDTN